IGYSEVHPDLQVLFRIQGVVLPELVQASLGRTVGVGLVLQHHVRTQVLPPLDGYGVELARASRRHTLDDQAPVLRRAQVFSEGVRSSDTTPFARVFPRGVQVLLDIETIQDLSVRHCRYSVLIAQMVGGPE